MRNLNLDSNRFFIRTKTLHNQEKFSTNLGAAVEFNLPDNGNVNLVLSEKNGAVICTLVDNEFLMKGFYLREIDLSNIPGGDYLYKFKTKSIEQTRELKLIK
jgi:hypothetical protein